MDADRGAPVYQGMPSMPHGCVFISYRAADQPLAAAAIHDALARRFGADRVFRDCASMGAGQHYPTAIRAALESATVLVAVVGPRWLTLIEPRTSGRPIDRGHDWVREEIACALRRGIPIIPVMLKDTPENAARLTPAELPEDIRQFAKLQTLEFSQRRFGEDLDRLAHRLLQLEPALATCLQYEGGLASLIDAARMLGIQVGCGEFRGRWAGAMPCSSAWSAQRGVVAMPVRVPCTSGGGRGTLASLCFERHLAIAPDLRGRASLRVEGESHLALNAKGSAGHHQHACYHS
jgi:TIR domain-containing protein